MNLLSSKHVYRISRKLDNYGNLIMIFHNFNTLFIQKLFLTLTKVFDKNKPNFM